MHVHATTTCPRCGHPITATRNDGDQHAANMRVAALLVEHLDAEHPIERAG